MNEDILEKLFLKEKNDLSELDVKYCIQVIDTTDIETIVSFLQNNSSRLRKITKSNIPQFGDFDAIGKVLLIVESSTEGLDYRRIGYFFNKDNNDDAQRKYGENHYKLAASLQLVSERKPYAITDISREIKNKSDKEKREFFIKMSLGIPVVQHIIVLASEQEVDLVNYLNDYLAPSTAIRRGSSVKKLLELILEKGNSENLIKIKKNLGWY